MSPTRSAFLKALAARLAPGGLLILSTPNATGWSKLLTDHRRRRARPDPQGHARFRQVHRPGPDEAAARRGRARMRRCRRHRLVADARAAPQRRYAAELSRDGVPLTNRSRARVGRSLATGDGMKQFLLLARDRACACGRAARRRTCETGTHVSDGPCVEPGEDGSCNRKTCRRTRSDCSIFMDRALSPTTPTRQC